MVQAYIDLFYLLSIILYIYISYIYYFYYPHYPINNVCTTSSDPKGQGMFPFSLGLLPSNLVSPSYLPLAELDES
jgi:hypothetical protein